MSDHPYLEKFYSMVAGLDETGERHLELTAALETAWHIEADRLEEHQRAQAQPQAGHRTYFPDDEREEAARKLLTLMGISPSSAPKTNPYPVDLCKHEFHECTDGTTWCTRCEMEWAEFLDRLEWRIYGRSIWT